MVAGLGTQNEADVLLTQEPDQRCLRRQAVPRSNHRQVGVVAAKGRKKPLGRVQLAVVLDLSVGLANRLGTQRNHFGPIEMDQHPRQQLVVVGNRPVAVMFLQAMGTVNLVGAEVLTAVEGKQVVSLEERERLKRLDSLEVSKDVGKARTKGRGLDVVENLTQL